MRLPKTRPMIVESGTGAPFPSALEGRAARPKVSPANDNRRPLNKVIRRGLEQAWRVLPPVVGAGVIIYALTH